MTDIKCVDRKNYTSQYLKNINSNSNNSKNFRTNETNKISTKNRKAGNSNKSPIVSYNFYVTKYYSQFSRCISPLEPFKEQIDSSNFSFLNNILNILSYQRHD